MQQITSSHLKMNQPPTISNGYKNWWDVVGQSQVIHPQVHAPSYGVYTHSINQNNVHQNRIQNVVQQPIIQQPIIQPQPMTLITNLNRGCGCQGAK